MWRYVGGGLILSAACLLWNAPDADADVDFNQISPDVNANIGAPSIGTTLILCPGVGAGADVGFGIGKSGGGWCDFDFTPSGMHVHCAWGGNVLGGGGWACWRVFRGQPDTPQLPDPDIVAPGFIASNALTGPTPQDQWPPPGLAPADQLPPPEGPPPGPPP